MKNSISTVISRRGLMEGLLAGVAAGTLVPARELLAEGPPASTLTFEEVAGGLDENHHVAKGYRADILLRWGDAVGGMAPAFDPQKQSSATQEKQFGYNCDFIAFMPLPVGSQNSDHGILCVNHEYTAAALMFPENLESDATAIEMAAHGMSFVEIKKTNDKWASVSGSRYNRRITATTKTKIAGPCAGHDSLKTAEDPAGIEVLGTIANCAGGVTPWGTVLTCEENFHNYFGGQGNDEKYAAYGIGGDTERDWWKTQNRFDLGKEPNEPNRFGWVVEIDPYDPASQPVKRTALGRTRHEGATCVLAKDGRVVVYMGDDGKFECVYKFVTRDKYDPANRAANMNLLDTGTLYAAQFGDDGKVIWLPLSGADDLLHTRTAAKRVGATPMDRPEDVEPNPVNGRVYVMLTNNVARGFFEKDAANPRSHNAGGHIIEINPQDGDHASEHGTWELFIVAGRPDADQKTSYGPGTSNRGWLACPDNCAFDNQGRIWITTDRGGLQETYGMSDGVYAADTTGHARAATKLFYRGPMGAEICGPCFTPDNKTLFVAVQHPGEGSGFNAPSTRWPDFKDDMPPRPSVVVISKDDGGVIGT